MVIQENTYYIIDFTHFCLNREKFNELLYNNQCILQKIHCIVESLPIQKKRCFILDFGFIPIFGTDQNFQMLCLCIRTRGVAFVNIDFNDNTKFSQFVDYLIKNNLSVTHYLSKLIFMDEIHLQCDELEESLTSQSNLILQQKENHIKFYETYPNTIKQKLFVQNLMEHYNVPKNEFLIEKLIHWKNSHTS